MDTYLTTRGAVQRPDLFSVCLAKLQVVHALICNGLRKPVNGGFACSEWKESWLGSSEFASRFRSKSSLTHC
jgi:hypothetical protein